MDRQLAEEIIACLQGERTVYHYYRDRYSIGLLSLLSRVNEAETASLHTLKNSPYAALLQKPRIKTALANLGKQTPSAAYWQAHDYDAQQEAFVLSLGTWGEERRGEWRYQQTSRPGCNLVLQMNFSGIHDREYAKLNARGEPFAYAGHPVAAHRHTLAWARIDLDLATNCALIEEIQTDWLRQVIRLESFVKRQLLAGQSLDEPIKGWHWANKLACTLRAAQNYAQFVRERYAYWDEAMLWAALSFLSEKIGIRDIYYHTATSGQTLKHIGSRLPPRSLYTDLPRRFCFTQTTQAPIFLAQEKFYQQLIKRGQKLEFFRLVMPESSLRSESSLSRAA